MINLPTAVGDRLAEALDLLLDFATLGQYGYQDPQLAAGTGRTHGGPARACAARQPAQPSTPVSCDRARRRLGAPAGEARALRA
jgi:hypothetical protein